MLTLPIVVGKSYVRRDGVVVVAQAPIHGGRVLAFVGEGEKTSNGRDHVYIESGLIAEGKTCALDLIADHPEQKPAGHPHAALMMLYAQDAAENSQPWLMWQHSYKGSENWINCLSSPMWDAETKYRRKPRTVKIGDCLIQAPERFAPAVGSPYWVVRVDGDDFLCEFDWLNDSTDKRLLSRGLVHLTPEAAEAHAKALIALTALK